MEWLSLSGSRAALTLALSLSASRAALDMTWPAAAERERENVPAPLLRRPNLLIKAAFVIFQSLRVKKSI